MLLALPGWKLRSRALAVAYLLVLLLLFLLLLLENISGVVVGGGGAVGVIVFGKKTVCW